VKGATCVDTGTNEKKSHEKAEGKHFPRKKKEGAIKTGTWVGGEKRPGAAGGGKPHFLVGGETA